MSDNIHNETACKLSIFHVIAMLLKNSKVILKITSCFVLIAVFYTLIATPCYNSYITILPLNGKQPNNVASFVGFTSFGKSAVDVAITVIGIIKSPAVLDRVLDTQQRLLNKEKSSGGGFKATEKKNFSIEKSRNALLSNMTVKSDINTGLITISVGARTPEESVEMTKALFEATQSVIQSLAGSPTVQTTSVLESQLKIASNELSKAGRELLEYNVKKAEIGRTPVHVRAVLDLQTQMIRKEMELRSAKTFGTKDNPRVKKLQSDYDAIKRELAQAGGLRNEYPFREQEDDTDVNDNTQQTTDDTLEYTEKVREYQAKEAAYKSLLLQLKEAKVAEDTCPFIIQAVGEPTIPEKRTKPERKKIVFRAGMLGLFCGVLITLFKGYIEYCRQDAEIAEQINYIISCFTKFKKKK